MSISERLGLGRLAEVAQGNAINERRRELRKLNLVDEEGNVLEYGEGAEIPATENVKTKPTQPGRRNWGDETAMRPVNLSNSDRQLPSG